MFVGQLLLGIVYTPLAYKHGLCELTLSCYCFLPSGETLAFQSYDGVSLGHTTYRLQAFNICGLQMEMLYT